MAFLQWGEGRRLGIPSNQLRTRKLKPFGKVSDTVATAQWFEFDIPTDSLIHSILITIGEDTTASASTRGTLADDLVDIELRINGRILCKNMKATMNKALHIMAYRVALGTGFYRVDFKDPRIPESRPLPAFLKNITSIVLRLQDNAPAGSNYHHIIPTLLEQDIPEGERENAKSYPLLMETYPKVDTSGGALTGWMEYAHERNQKVYGYLYEFGDNGSLEDPAVDGFDFIKLEGRSPAGVDWIIEETNLLDFKEINKAQYGVALPTGYVNFDFPQPLNTRQYTNLYTRYNIDTACTASQLRVLERYLLG